MRKAGNEAEGITEKDEKAEVPEGTPEGRKDIDSKN